MALRRGRLVYVVLWCGTVVAGLLTRAVPQGFPSMVAEFGGDVLWASMVYWTLVIARPRAAPWRAAAWAAFVALTVELSQLWHTPWLDALRTTTLGALMLGQGFLWSDLLCYALGVVLAFGVDVLLRRR